MVTSELNMKNLTICYYTVSTTRKLRQPDHSILYLVHKVKAMIIKIAYINMCALKTKKAYIKKQLCY